MRLGKYQTEMELNQKVDILKATFKEAVASIDYREKDAYLDQVCANLINTGLRHLLQQARIATKDESKLL